MAKPTLAEDYRQFARVIDDFVASFGPNPVSDPDIDMYEYDDWVHEPHKDPLITRTQLECGDVGTCYLSEAGTRQEGYAMLRRLAKELREAADALDARDA